MNTQPEPNQVLTSESAKLLVKGDVLRDKLGGLLIYEPRRFLNFNGGFWTFVGRPDPDGWIVWSLVPGFIPSEVCVETDVRFADGHVLLGYRTGDPITAEMLDHGAITHWRPSKKSEDQGSSTSSIPVAAEGESAGQRPRVLRDMSGTESIDWFAKTGLTPTELFEALSHPVEADVQASGLREVAGWQRRMRNTQAAADHPWAQWSKWKECDEEQVAYHNATGGKLHGFPDLETQVRPIYANPQLEERCGQCDMAVWERNPCALGLDASRADALSVSRCAALTAGSTSTCGMSEANEPKPLSPTPSEGGVEPQREAIEREAKHTFGPYLPDGFTAAHFSAFTDRVLALASPTHQAPDVSGLVWRDMKSAPRDGSDIVVNHKIHGVIQAHFWPGEWSEDTPNGPAEYDGDMWVLGDDLAREEVEFGPDGWENHGNVLGWMPLYACPVQRGENVSVMAEALDRAQSILIAAADRFRREGFPEAATALDAEARDALEALQVKND